jgi:hypothetical protein
MHDGSIHRSIPSCPSIDRSSGLDASIRSRAVASFFEIHRSWTVIVERVDRSRTRTVRPMSRDRCTTDESNPR